MAQKQKKGKNETGGANISIYTASFYMYWYVLFWKSIVYLYNLNKTYD